jgi:hypothetical protein
MKKLIDNLKKEFKERLVCVGLHNIGFMIEEKKNGLLVILDKTEGRDLQIIKNIYVKYGRKVSNPIIVNETFFRNTGNIFCIETLQMQENLNILYGKDLLQDIKIEKENLRKQCEYELRGKLLTLKGSFLSAYWERKTLHDLLIRSAYNFSLIIKGFLYLKEKEVENKTKEELFGLFEETYAKKLSALRKIVQLKKTPLSELIPLFTQYVDEMEAIVAII